MLASKARGNSLATLAAAAALGLGSALAACHDEPDTLGEAVEEMGDEASDKLEDAGDKIEDAGDELEDKLD